MCSKTKTAAAKGSGPPAGPIRVNRLVEADSPGETQYKQCARASYRRCGKFCTILASCCDSWPDEALAETSTQYLTSERLMLQSYTAALPAIARTSRATGP